MRKKIMNFTALAVILFLGACSNQDEILTEKIEPERTITLTASMPDEPDTRVALTPDGKNINLTWQSGDRLQFAFVQGTTKVKSIYEIKPGDLSNGNNRVEFTLALPDDPEFDINANFDLYGLYGNYIESGLIDVDPTNVVLTKTPSSRGTLTRVQNRGDVMLYFESKNINPNNPPTSVTFNHLGSLFGISFNNTENPTASTITEARLVGVDSLNVNWAFNNDAGGKIFDMLTKQFQNTNTAGNYISFTTTESTWAAGVTTTLWAWYPPIPNQKWPALRLQMTDTNGNMVLSSTNIKPIRPTAPEAGKTYHFYARWDGTELNFTTDQYVTTPSALN